MKNKWMMLVAAAGAAAVLFMGGMFAANTVFAAEEVISADGGVSETLLHALTGAEAKNAYKKETYGDLGCMVVLPDGYVPSETVKGMYVSERNPLDSSNIYYAVSENTDAEALKQMLDSDEYKKRMEDKLMETYGSEASVVSFRDTEMEIDGCPAYKVELACQTDDARMEQLIYIIVADKTYTITYSQSADDERMEEFEKSGETIRVVFAEK